MLALITCAAIKRSFTLNIKGVLFDLDGTLLDTARDLLAAMNHTLEKYQRSPVSYDTFKSSVFGGADLMITETFNIPLSHPDFNAIKEYFLTYYAENIAQYTRLYPDMGDLLDYIEQEKLPWGIVTNKTTLYTLPLLDALALKERIHCLVMGDTLPYLKPHPAPLLHACNLIGKNPAEVVYIGDYKTDVEAAHAAGMPAIIITHGYYPVHENPAEWQADLTVNTARQIINHLKKT